MSVIYKEMIVFPPCKINLGLSILNKRPDGYHNIETVMAVVPWCDILEVTPAENAACPDALEVSGNTVNCPVEDNLVMKAVRALRKNHKFPTVSIRLHKIVPDGAGLGGGSSDAAYTIRAINELFYLGMDVPEMARVLAEVGSDCPFFAYDRPMLATDTGTTLAPVDVDLSDWTLVVAKPSGVAVSTRQAYNGVKPGNFKMLPSQAVKLPVEDWRENMENDFEQSVFAVAPEIRILRDNLYNIGATYAAMSGSGAAVFGLFRDMPNSSLLNSATAGCVKHVSKL